MFTSCFCDLSKDVESENMETEKSNIILKKPFIVINE